MTRLAYLSTDPGIYLGAPKGAAVHVAELTGALATSGTDVLLVIAGVIEEPSSPRPGVAVEVLPGPGKGATTSARLAAESERRRWLEHRLAHFAPDVLYERLALHSAAGSRAARAMGIPHLVELNAPLPEEARRYRRLDAPLEADMLEREALSHADLVLAVSPPLAEYATARGARRVEVMPNAVADERLERAPSHQGRDPAAIFAGTLRPWHGVETIAEAWEMLGTAAPRLLVAGDGPGRERLAEVGGEILGFLSQADLALALAGAQIGLAPYGADAPAYFSPLKLFEYMAAGLAVVAGDLPAVRQVVTEESAVLVPRGDAEALAAAVAGLALDAPRRKHLGEAARTLVAAEHTWGRRARRVLDAVGAGAPAPA